MSTRVISRKIALRHSHPRVERQSASSALLIAPYYMTLPFTTVRRVTGVKEILMNEDKIKGQWKQLAGKLKTKWGKLTEDDVKITEGDSEYLAGKIQERYGIAKDEAHRQVKEFGRSL
jgi:uncharacterized protein YjbJ (UPF0337 family)